MIPITKTYLPPFKEYTDRLEKIWPTGWITSNGPLVKELADKLCVYLDVPDIELVASGTLALQLWKVAGSFADPFRYQFVVRIKNELEITALHRSADEAEGSFILREPGPAYRPHFDARNKVIRT